MDQLKNKTVIITGAGSGMGRAMANLFASAGANVVGTDVREDRLEQLQKEIKASNGIISVIKANIGDEKESGQMIQQAISSYKSLDVLINNAGILDDFMPVADLSTELWNKVMSVNINGPFFTCRAAVPQMLKQGKGVIINIASIGGLCGSRAGVAYTTSKHDLIGLTKNIGFMYAQKGIRCNAIAPGSVQTNIGEGMHPNQFGYEKLSLGLPSNPRNAEPNEIAEIALFLASERASFINGSVITADGGWTAY
jgi:NAD(P)-dependent dehydrogenase (short-subunit alcohol dehydrogenase family)